MNFKIKLIKGLVFWHWVIISRNGQIVGTSETYYSKANALRAAKKLSKATKFPLEDK